MNKDTYIKLGFNEREIRMILREKIPFNVVYYISKLNDVNKNAFIPGVDECIKAWKYVGNAIFEWDVEDIIFYTANCLGLPSYVMRYRKEYNIRNVAGAYMCNVPFDKESCAKFIAAGEIPVFYKKGIVLPQIIIDEYTTLWIDKNIEKITLNEEFGVWAPLFAFTSPAKVLGEYADKKSAHRFFIETRNMDLTNEKRPIWVIYLEWAGMKELVHVAYSRLIFEWAMKHWNAADMVRVRRAYGPAGSVYEYTYRELIREIAEEDIETINDSVEKVFERMNNRIEKEMNKNDDNVNYDFPEAPYVGNDNIVYISDYKTLVQVAKYMQNCARTYAPAIMQRKTALYQVNDGGKNVATMEVANGKVYQLFAQRNTEPADSIKKIVRKWCNENNIIFDKE